MSTTIELFIIGITMSFGPCLLFCSPVILSYIAATRRGWKQGLGAILIFYLGRLISYCLMGFLAGVVGRVILERLHQFDYLIFLIGGLFISLIGFLIIFEGEYNHYLCQLLKKYFVNDNFKGPVILGLMLGILPCLPFLGVLTFIALKTQYVWQGAFFGLAFGIGQLISPLILLGVVASTVPALLMKSPKVYNVFSKICGFILFFIGINLIVSKLIR